MIGFTDATTQIARRCPVDVIDPVQPGKGEALNAGRTFPADIYLLPT